MPCLHQIVRGSKQNMESSEISTSLSPQEFWESWDQCGLIQTPNSSQPCYGQPVWLLFSPFAAPEKSQWRQYNPNTHLSFSDVATNNPSHPTVISVNIKLSKTDQGRVGYLVVLGKTDDVLCPVMALLQSPARRGGLPGALFQWQDGTQQSLWKQSGKVCLQQTSQQYAGHSFRIGAATTAAMMGLQDSAIQIISKLSIGNCKPKSYQVVDFA